MKTLVSFYSRTGFTGRIAKEIAAACNADLEQIQDVRGNGKGAGYWRSALEAALHLQAPIRETTHWPGSYDLVIIGTPIWCWNIPGPVRSYLSSCAHQISHVAFFCTCGGAGQNKVLRNLETMSGQVALARLALTDQEIQEERYQIQLADFVAKIKDPNTLHLQEKVTEADSYPLPGNLHS